jgi:hypothetical protein
VERRARRCRALPLSLRDSLRESSELNAPESHGTDVIPVHEAAGSELPAGAASKAQDVRAVKGVANVAEERRRTLSRDDTLQECEG